jgi:tetratricopeptide (TPR) repeat protein
MADPYSRHASSLFLVSFRSACAGLLLTACAAGPDPADAGGQREQGTVGAGGAASEEERVAASAADVEAAVAALRAGDFKAARELTTDLAYGAALARGRAHLAAGDPRAALVPFDEALEMKPDAAEALYLRASAAFATAEAGDPQAGFFYGDAATGFLAAAKAGYGVEAALRASRAAYLSGEIQTALEVAREAMQWLDGAPDRRGTLMASITDGLVPERVWADAAFGAYVAARNANVGAATALFAETEDALGRLAAATPTDSYPLTQLANLALWEGQRSAALGHIEAALTLNPSAEEVHNMLVRELRAGAYAAAWSAAGGPSEAPAADAPSTEQDVYKALVVAATRAQRDAVLARYETLQAAQPDNALVHWYAATERFQRALEAYEAGTLEESEFQRAERDFRRCRELQEDYANTCRGWEVFARTAVGWCRYWGGNLDGAEESFWSTEELLEGALDSQYEGRLGSALVGLSDVAQAYTQRADDLAAMSKAAALGDALYARRPDNADLANNAGLLNRDAAVLHEAASRRMQAEALRAPDTEGAEAARAEATRLRERAQHLMQQSWAAYQVAARLAPEDVRVVNDTGLVMAYYLRTDREAAEQYFRTALELGKQQLADYEARGETPPEDLLIAYGDAHQNIGTLALTFDGDLAAAREWFVKACEVAPDDRPEIDQILPALEASLAAGAWTEELRAFERMLVWKD